MNYALPECLCSEHVALRILASYRSWRAATQFALATSNIFALRSRNFSKGEKWGEDGRNSSTCSRFAWLRGNERRHLTFEGVRSLIFSLRIGRCRLVRGETSILETFEFPARKVNFVIEIASFAGALEMSRKAKLNHWTRKLCNFHFQSCNQRGKWRSSLDNKDLRGWIHCDDRTLCTDSSNASQLELTSLPQSDKNDSFLETSPNFPVSLGWETDV